MGVQFISFSKLVIYIYIYNVIYYPLCFLDDGKPTGKSHDILQPLGS